MGVDFGRGADGEENAMVAALLEVHRRKQRLARSAVPHEAHSRILDHFERRGQRLRGEKLVTAELIERLFAAGAAIPARRPQQEIEIWGQAGGTAAGRARVINRTSASASFELVVGEPTEGKSSVDIRFEPASGTLAPNEALFVRVEASLMDWQAGARITVPVECRWRDGTDRLWLVIAAHTEPGPAR
jgi:hypothetical protein